MSIIAVSNVHPSTKMPVLLKALANKVKGQFEALNFVMEGRKKVCYLRLSERLDPLHVTDVINQTTRYEAYVPDYVPDMQLARRRMVPTKTGRRLGIRTLPQDQLLSATLMEILIEMQCKFSGLFNLSKKTGDKLMENIAQTVFERLKHIMLTNPDGSATEFKLTNSYRKLHPHFGDFQFILSTLHRLQDTAGVARTQLNEQELTKVSNLPNVGNVPYDKVRAVSNKYSERIIAKIIEHVNNLEIEPVNPTDPEEDIAKKKVRAELKKMAPYIPLIIKQVITNHILPKQSAYHRVRIYGEPFLPSRDLMAPFMRDVRPLKVQRSHKMYNMLFFNVPMSEYSKLMDLDGAVVGGAKLVIRSSDIPTYSVKASLLKQIRDVFNPSDEGRDEAIDDQVPMEDEAIGDQEAMDDEEYATVDDWVEDENM